MNQPLHVRRCHVCHGVCESEEDILKCSFCGKSLLPFYYFDKRKIVDYADNEVRPEPLITGENQKGSRGAGDVPSLYGPIRGLTAYW